MVKGKVLVCALVVAGFSTPAVASVQFELKDSAGNDSGWVVNGPSFLEVGIATDAVNKESVDQDDWYALIQISKKFRVPPDPDGNFSPITLTFIQVAEDAATVPHIRIADETITNQTGADWLDFHYVLYKHGYASFDQSVNIFTGTPDPAPDDVFDVYPFTQYQWYTDGLNLEKLELWGGTVPDGDSWYPGIYSNGYLEIDIDLAGADPGFSFDLKELPTVPEPSTLVLLLLGAAGVLTLGRRRRKRSA